MINRLGIEINENFLVKKKGIRESGVKSSDGLKGGLHCIAIRGLNSDEGG